VLRTFGNGQLFLFERKRRKTKIAYAIFEIIVFALFFIRKKRAVKEAEKRAVLSLCHFCFLLKLLSPPRVEILLRQNLLGTTANFYVLQIFYSLQSGAQE